MEALNVLMESFRAWPPSRRCPSGAPAQQRRLSSAPVSKNVAVVLLIALTGFLIGGVYTSWKTTRTLAIALLVCAILAAGGAIAWFVS